MEARLGQVRQILNRLTDQHGGSPQHSSKGRFWNLSRDAFLTGPVYGRPMIIEGDPDNSFLVKILQEQQGGFVRMPPGGPYITDEELEFIVEWIRDGAPDEAGRL